MLKKYINKIKKYFLLLFFGTTVRTNNKQPILIFLSNKNIFSDHGI